MTSRTLWVASVVAILIALHFSLRPILEWRAGIDFLLIAVLVVAVRSRPGVAAVAGFAFGLVADALTPEAFGAGALGMTVVGFAASRLKGAFFADNVMLHAVFVFVGKVAFDLIVVLAERRIGGAALAVQLLAWTPLAALCTACVGIFVMSVVRPSRDRRRA